MNNFHIVNVNDQFRHQFIVKTILVINLEANYNFLFIIEII